MNNEILTEHGVTENHLCSTIRSQASFRMRPPYVGKGYQHGAVVGIHELKLQLLLPVAHVRVKKCPEG
jgi:hypothetical protein